jgi:hypothetical protein
MFCIHVYATEKMITRKYQNPKLVIISLMMVDFPDVLTGVPKELKSCLISLDSFGLMLTVSPCLRRKTGDPVPDG